jgi:hypothetical protein
VVIGGREEVDGRTRIDLDLGAENLQLSELRVEVADPVFSRNCKLNSKSVGEEGEVVEKTLARGAIYRVLGEDGAVIEQLAIPIHARVAEQSLVLVIENGDSPPLAIKGTSAARYPTTLLFFAPEAGEWILLSGNDRAAAPRYDISSLRGELKKADGVRVSPGPLVEKTDYQRPPALPGIDPAGTDLDLADWAYRRAVSVAGIGVVRIDVDAAALARCRTDLGDLRVIQNGRQVPYLIESSSRRAALSPVVEDDPDPKRPGVSRWKINLPMEDLPAAQLVVDSPAKLFSRNFRVVVAGEDHLGNPWTRTIGSGAWTRNGGGKSSPLHLNLGGYRMPETFHLETDNGDNPAITIEAVELRHARPSLVLKLSESAPLNLYYGNPKMWAPRYDLSLVRGELLSADKQLAVLGEVEVLHPEASRKRGDVNAGSPWLWVALGLVVALLLVVVAKMIPRGEVA